MRYLVRHVFHSQRGKVPELLEDVKVMDGIINSTGQARNTRICVDVTGRFDTIVHDAEVESVDAVFESERAMYANLDERARQLTDGLNANTVAGYREIYEILK